MVFLHEIEDMIVFPNAKINIGLRITGKRPDGYHNIETVFYPVKLCDALEFVISDQSHAKDILKVTGLDTGGEQDDNLVIIVLKKIRSKYRFPYLNIHLHKVIPVGAGLGGGSSDAACTGKIINKHFNLNIDNHDLKAMLLEVGSDCPFFVDCVPSLASGRGEIFAPVKNVLSGYYLVLLNPGVGINTGEAYKNSPSAVPASSLSMLIEYPVTEWKKFIFNDFEDFAFRRQPVITDFKDELYKSGALFSLMSGSGSSVYGIFASKPQLPEKIKKFVIWEGIL
jgi:4-diphosphocytidyl-2-C-methyl-D-erythritol kinase